MYIKRIFYHCHNSLILFFCELYIKGEYLNKNLRQKMHGIRKNNLFKLCLGSAPSSVRHELISDSFAEQTEFNNSLLLYILRADALITLVTYMTGTFFSFFKYIIYVYNHIYVYVNSINCVLFQVLYTHSSTCYLDMLF